jgi:superfamily I DNA/RNA helicase
MKNTAEQNTCVDIYSDKKPFKVEAVAGSGKTTTVRIMAESDMERSALYLAFNKAAADEAAEKMPSNTECRTTHSIAYRSIIGSPNSVLGSKLSRPAWNPKKYVNAGGTVKEIKNLAKVKDVPGANKLAIARVAKQSVACFEASASNAITEDHIPYVELQKLRDKAAKLDTAFSEKQFIKGVLCCAETLWQARIDETSPVVMSHDTYLKLYQLSKPVLNYDVIFLDEAQDTSDCVIDIVMQQMDRGTQVVCVGDTYQSIYGWRGAVNALAKIDTKSTPLSQSWRYGPEVASVATYILDSKMIVKGSPHLDTKVGTVDTTKPYTQLFRTNIKLIQQGIKLIRQGVKVRMDVDVKGFVKMLTSLIALKYGDNKNVKHEDVVIHSTWDDLLDEAEVVKGELKLLSSLVERGNAQEVLDILGGYTKARNPHVILSTAHKSKGMEYPQVILGDDFMDVFDDEGNFIEPSDMERNLMYVAATRAIECLQLNKTVSDIIAHRKRGSDLSFEEDHDRSDMDNFELEGLLEMEASSIEEKFDKVVGNQVRSLQTDLPWRA